MKTTTIVLTAALTILSGAALAQSAAESDTQQPELLPGPGVQLKQGMDKLLAFIGQPDGPDAAALADFLDREIAPFFDFEYMSQSAAGPVWRRMTPEQQAQLTDRIKRSFLATMATRLGNYRQQRIRYLANRVSSDQRTAVVGVAILSPDSYPARLDFRFYKGSDGWKVFDVMANGQSAVVYYRRQFRQMMMSGMRQHGYPGYPYRR